MLFDFKDRIKISKSEDKKQDKIKEVKERIKVLDNLSFLGAKSIKEYKQLQYALKDLTKEQDYHNWFQSNEEILKDIFDFLFESFAKKDNKEVTFLVNNDKGCRCIVYNKEYIVADYFTELLKKYGYFCYWKYEFGEKIVGLIVKYEPREEF